MARFIYLMYVLWFLLLPLTVISSTYLGMAIDKKMAPLLILSWAALYLMGKANLDQRKISLLLIAFSFFFIRNLSFINNSTVLIEMLWEDVIRFGYFAIPILFLNNNQKVKTATKMISFNAMIGCVTAFLVAFGMLTLPYERFSQSRIGFEDIQKSIGLFSSYGDLAQHAAFFMVVALVIPSNFFTSKKNLVRLIVVTIVIMGLIGTQSRSYLLSLIAAPIMCAIFYYRSQKTTNKTLNSILLTFAAIIIVVVIAYMFRNIVSVLSNMGGSQASATAEGRLGQYQLAFSLIKEFPILGVDSEFYLKNGYIGHFVHNMWLGQLVRGGFVSAIVLLILLLTIFKRTVTLLSDNTTQPYALISLGYMAALFISTLFYPADSMLFWALLGMNAAIVYTIKPEFNNNNGGNEENHSKEITKQTSILKYRDRNVR